METREAEKYTSMNTATMNQHVLKPERSRGPFIFFTWEGMAWMAGALAIFIFALASGTSYLLVFSLLLTGLTVVVIFLTHENIDGIGVSAVAQEIDLLSGQSFVKIVLVNTSASMRYQIRLRVELEAEQRRRLVTALPCIGPGQSLPVRLLLPWTEPSEAAPLLRTIFIESRFPCGLARSWKLPRRADFAKTRNLVPVPQPQVTVADTPDTPTTDDNQASPSDMLAPYRSENPARIDWMTSFRVGEILVRNNVPWNNSRPPRTGNPSILWNPAQAGDHKRVFREALENLRWGHSFTVYHASQGPCLEWQHGTVSPGAVLAQLLGMLHQQESPKPGPVGL